MYLSALTSGWQCACAWQPNVCSCAIFVNVCPYTRCSPSRFVLFLLEVDRSTQRSRLFTTSLVHLPSCNRAHLHSSRALVRRKSNNVAIMVSRRDRRLHAVLSSWNLSLGVVYSYLPCEISMDLNSLKDVLTLLLPIVKHLFSSLRLPISYCTRTKWRCSATHDLTFVAIRKNALLLLGCPSSFMRLMEFLMLACHDSVRSFEQAQLPILDDKLWCSSMEQQLLSHRGPAW